MYKWIDKDNDYVSENPRDAINGAAFIRQLTVFLRQYSIYVVSFFVISVFGFSYLILKGFFSYYGIQTLPNDLTSGIVLAISWILVLFAITVIAMLVMRPVRNIWLASILCGINANFMVGSLIHCGLYFLSEVSNFGYLIVYMFRYELFSLVVLWSLFFALSLMIYIALFKNVYRYRLTITSLICLIMIGAVLFSFTLKPLGSIIARFDTTKEYIQLENDKCLIVIGYAADQPLVMKCDIIQRVMRIKYQQGYFRLNDTDAVIQRDTFHAVILDSLFD